MKLLIIFALSTLAAFASNNDITHRPPGFSYQSSRAVFVDFEEAVYDITFDIAQKKADVTARFKMHMPEEGHPVFDVMAEPTLVKIDGEEVRAAEVTTPSNETKVRVISKKLSAGAHDLIVKVPLSSLIQYTTGGVKSAFWVTDLEDRYYLERYIPVNLEYDRVKMTFNLNFVGLTEKQHIFANGDVKWTAANSATVEFPEYFTVNSLYFHTTPIGSVVLKETNFKSKDGRDIPVAIYQGPNEGENLETLRSMALTVFNELERDYGPFPHKSITIYNASLAHMGLGGMEYAGATVTNRGALASWRDNGYNRLNNIFGSSSMAAHATYTRKTDTAAYGFGARFMAFLDAKFAAKGGLKPFMNKLLEKKIFEPIFTEDFIREMEAFYGEKVQDVFNTYVYKRSSLETLKSEKEHKHYKPSLKELESIL